MKQTYLLSGRHSTDLANAISDAIFAARQRGVEMDQIVCIAAAVVADYGRGAYGDSYLPCLAHIVLGRAGQTLPSSETVQ
jgi:hypothetical protein